MHGDLTFTVTKLWNKKPEDIGTRLARCKIKLKIYIFYFH